MEIAASAHEHVRDDLSASFEERFQEIRPRLTAVCTAIAGVDDAQDLVHETYLRATERLHQLRDPQLFEAWVVRIALNEAKTVVRQRRRFVGTPAESERQRADSSDAGLRQLVQQLPPKERAVIVLHYAYGYRMREIGRLLDLSEINVRTLAFRARRRLRHQLEETLP